MATAKDLIKVATAEVGYLEKANKTNLDDKTANAGSNNYTKYARDLDSIPDFYNGKKNGYAWCDVFVDWCFVKAFGTETALKLLGQPKSSYGAGCSWSAKYFKSINRFFTNPKAGDQIFFINSIGNVNHTGIVYDVDSKYVYTIEGNTSSASGVIANGGSVEKKKYKLSYKKIYGYGRPMYDIEAPQKAENKVLEWQTAAIKDGFKFPRYGADGEWGAECESVAKKAIVKYRKTYEYPNLTKIVQKAVGVTADGKCGSKTAAAIEAYQIDNDLSACGCVHLETWKSILQSSGKSDK